MHHYRLHLLCSHINLLTPYYKQICDTVSSYGTKHLQQQQQTESNKVSNRGVLYETLVFSSDTSGQITVAEKNLCNHVTDLNLVQVSSVIMCLLSSSDHFQSKTVTQYKKHRTLNIKRSEYDSSFPINH